MAGLSTAPDTRDQVAAIAHLRWQMFIHSLRTRRGAAELASRVFVGVFIFVGGISGAVGFGLAAYIFVSEGKVVWLGALLWVVFVFWLVFPLMATAFSENADSSIFLRFPVKYPAYLLVNLLYGTLDPNTVLGGLWLLGITCGIASAAPRLLPWAVCVFTAFALGNIFLTRMIFAWIERWLAQRRTRELMGIIFFLLIIGFQFVGPVLGSHRRPATRVIKVGRQLTPVERILPPGAAAQSLDDMSHGSMAGALGWFAVVCAYAGTFLFFLHLRLRAQYRGENLSEASGTRLRKREREPARTGWRIPFLPHTTEAMFEKELRYLARSGPMLFTLIMPVIMLLIFRIGPASGESGFLNRAPNLAFPAGTAYAMLLLTNLVFNNFGNDAGGIQLYFALPVHFREIVGAKNLAHLTVLAVEMIFLWVGITFIYARPSIDVSIATLAGILFAAPVNLILGNVLSIYSPKKIDFGTFGRQRASATTVLASFAIQLATFGFGAAILFWSLGKGNLWLAALVFLLLAVLGWTAYTFTMRKLDGVVEGRREVLIEELCRT